ncbi:cytochrome c-type biogenesis protein [Phenylobacterium sp.]|uniref:cytochrome c-type biogenesis protein n=1 Tax=Phenylobacterium sp. TaxID=1871053 RepID=UPI0025EDA058|nr:cytochrome c-type biogenesis protein [Phenylobacterium sp.]
MKRLLPIVAALALLAGPAAAVNPDEQLADPKLEARALKLSQELRCVVCQNQSIDDSDAELARDLRLILRERIAAGDTDEQAMDHIVSRYGSFVQLRPPLRWDTVLLWFGPVLVLVLGGVGAAVYVRGRSSTAAAVGALNADEEAELARMLDGDKVG